MKTVVITGSTRGLGFEMAKQFRSRGYNVVLCGTRKETVEEALVALSKLPGEGKVCGRTCDVSKREDVAALADLAVTECGGIDVWINNAGVNQSHAYFWELSEQEVDLLLKTDLKGAVNGTAEAVRRMSGKGGVIYNVEGMGSNDAFQTFFSLYGTAKRGMTYFTDAAAREVAEKKLPVIIGKLSPGIMITDFLTSANGKKGQTVLDEKTKKVYNILGDRPDTIAAFLVEKMEKNKKNGVRIEWLTGRKAAWRFMTAGITKRKVL